MAKGVTKKKNRKLRRQIRKTVGALLMVSAIVVAAIPVPDVRADDPSTTVASLPDKVWVWDQDISGNKPDLSIQPYCKSTIPKVSDDAIIYTSGDGRFQFAYVDTGNGIRVGVILNYNAGALTTSSLKIDDSMEAFRKYRGTTTDGYYCLVTQNNEFMYYDAPGQGRDENGRLLYIVPDVKYTEPDGEHPVPGGDTTHKPGDSIIVNEAQLYIRDGKLMYLAGTDTEGNEILYDVDEYIVMTKQPCYAEQRTVWGGLDDEELYYEADPTATDENDRFKHPNRDQSHYRINASMQYIGKQFIDTEYVLDGNGQPTSVIKDWHVRKNEYRDEPNEGVFANNSNITTLEIGESMSGISDYAFFGCGTLNQLSFGNNLATIGNGAFEDCIRLTTIQVPENSNLMAIGKRAFYNCGSLSDFTVPIAVRAIGDSCFEKCSNLTSIDLGGGDLENEPSQTFLQTIGNYTFKDCSSLGALFLPEQYSESALQAAAFQGCSKLQFVRVPNKDFNLAETADIYTFDSLKKDMPESFYIWGADTDTDDREFRSALHKTANENEIAYKYWDKEVYEVVIEEEDSTEPNKPRITYQVNDQNELQKIWLENNPVNVVIPNKIGPYSISTIGTGCFDNACSIERVIIPGTVNKIAAGAFKGSHALQKIIFNDASTITDIGEDAFRTQVVSCNHTPSERSPKLTIVGAMMDSNGNDTVPFAYAMQRENMINNNNQDESWITFHSGWPTNLEIKYNYDFTTQEGGSELQSYPRYSNFVNSTETTNPDGTVTVKVVPDETKIGAYVDALPYVNTSDSTDAAYLKAVIKEAIEKYEANNPGDPPTVEQAQIVNASKNIVVPTNVQRMKKGIFSGRTYEKDVDENTVPVEVADIDGPDINIQSVTLNGVDTIEPFTFTGCSSLSNVSVIGATEIGDYAFGALEEFNAGTGKIDVTDACSSLTNVTLGDKIVTTGLRPFRGCENLTQIECLGENMSYRDGLLFNQVGGQKVLVECLPGRGNKVGSYTVEPGELNGVTGLQKEAFMDCNEVGKIDLSESQIPEIPERAFSNADQLNSVILPDTADAIEKDAFINAPLLRVVTIPPSITYIEKDAFVTRPRQQKIEFECVEKSAADRYAGQNSDYITPIYGKVNLRHTVYFWDYPNYPDRTEKEIFDKQSVIDGQDAVPPTIPPVHEGYDFSGWTDYTNVTRDLDVYPMFGTQLFSVKFLDWDGTELIPEQFVEEGKSATPPAEEPSREGWEFTGWTPDYHDVHRDLVVIASYTRPGEEGRFNVNFYAYKGGSMQLISEQKVYLDEAAVAPAVEERPGYRFVGWFPDETVFSKVTSDLTIVASYEPVGGSSTPNPNPSGGNSGNNGGNTGSPSPSGGNGNNGGSSPSASPTARTSASPSATPTATPSNGNDVVKYTVSVSGGSGSGSYPAGAVVAINAYFMGEGQVFDKWASSTAGVGFANPNAASTTFTMPAANVSVTATYKTGGAGTAATNASGGTGGRNSVTGTATNNSGTRVDVTRPGISNTNLAGATVSGATDNFVVKVTEDQSATSAATAALQARFGDLSRIKYFPMDISLYDSTGRTKIADTSGISVNLTLPLPDELVQYAGNNRIAAIAGGALEDLNARFTTIDGVPCINFTATHFSPYVIYVDTANLTEATIDSTPKTGDPIHPKWFLALGMACMSLILFFKRDKVVINTKTA